jgi:hypothetical protein
MCDKRAVMGIGLPRKAEEKKEADEKRKKNESL